MEDEMPYNIYEGAIESIDACVNEYKVSFVIGRTKRGWRFTVMGKTFTDRNFIEAAKGALIFVHNSHNPDNILKNE